MRLGDAGPARRGARRRLDMAWGRAWRVWRRRGLDAGMAELLADAAERGALQARRRRRRWT